MTLPIVLASNSERRDFQDHFLKRTPSFFRDYVYISETMNQEIGALLEASQLFPRFLLMQDSMWIGNWNQFLKDVEQIETGYVIPRPSAYCMIYLSHLIQQMLPLPMPGQCKESAIRGETMVCDRYEQLAGGKLPVIYSEMTDYEALSNDRFYELCGQRRLHLRSDRGVFNKAKFTYR